MPIFGNLRVGNNAKSNKKLGSLA